MLTTSDDNMGLYTEPQLQAPYEKGCSSTPGLQRVRRQGEASRAVCKGACDKGAKGAEDKGAQRGTQRGAQRGAQRGGAERSLARKQDVDTQGSRVKPASAS